MVVDRLKIFISGKEDELANERATIRELVENLGFYPVSSEDRPASETKIDIKYVKELHDSHIYVGVFGKRESKPSMYEFKKAGQYFKPRLVFIKNMKTRRQPGMEASIKKIKKEVTVVNFELVTDLRDRVRDAIAETITTQFTRVSKGEA